MDKMQLTERDICTKFITPALEQAGWDIATQVREEFPLTKGRIDSMRQLAMPSATAASRQPVLPSPRSCRRYRGFPRTMATQPRSRRCWTNLPLSSNGISDWREEKAYEVPSNHIQHSSLIFKESYL